VTLGFSPLAFAFLVVALLAVALRRRVDRRMVLVGCGLVAAATVQIAVLELFPSEGRYPYNPLSLLGVLSAVVLAAPLALRSEHGRALGLFLLLWGAVNLVAFFVPSPFGDNLARLRYVLFPLVLLAVLLARARPRPIALAALTAALIYNVAPDISALPKRAGDADTAREAYWAPALGFLRQRSTADYRVEVVPTFGHWEAWWVPHADFALARGWYRQLDLAQNPELYENPLTPPVYRAWLRRLSVRYVLLPRARLGPLGAGREADLLRSGRAGLTLVFHSRDWHIYRVPHPVKILTGPAPARLRRFDHASIVGTVRRRGEYRLRVRYTPLLEVRSGAICIAPADDGMTRVLAKRGGRFELSSHETPVGALRAAIEKDEPTCGRGLAAS
jgi:hypothetical protein